MKKTAWIAIAGLALLILTLVLVCVFVPSVFSALFGGAGCAGGVEYVSATDQQPVSRVKEGEELMAEVETREEAEALAEQYEITLVRFSHGIAIFHCEGNPFDVIKRGRENGWTLLRANKITTLSPIEGADAEHPEAVTQNTGDEGIPQPVHEFDPEEAKKP